MRILYRYIRIQGMGYVGECLNNEYRLTNTNIMQKENICKLYIIMYLLNNILISKNLTKSAQYLCI